MEKRMPTRRWMWYFTLAAAVVLLYKLSDNIGQAVGLIGTLIGILSPFVVGLVLALFLYAPSSWIENKLKGLKGRLWQKMARPLAIFLVYLGLFGLIGLLGWLVLPVVTSNLTKLVSAMPQYIDAATKQMEQFAQSDGLLGQNGLGPRLLELYQSLLESVRRLMTTENLLSALKGVGSVAASVVDVVIAFIVSVYMLAGRESLRRELRAVASLFLKPRWLDMLRDYAAKSAHIFTSYFYSALLDAILVGVVVTVGLLIFRVPYAVLLGMGMGLLNMIPYFGATVGGVAVAVITLLTTNLYTALAVVIYIVVVQQVDANVVQPRVVGDSVGLRPIYVLLSITLFGGIFGFWGIFFGVPLMAVVQMLVKDAIRHKNSRQLSAETEAKTETN